MKGYVHIYCGDGKGKTTAAIGLAIRALGSGQSVLLVRFLKNNESSELRILEQLNNMTILPVTKDFGFYKNMTEETKLEAAKYYSELLKDAIRHSQGNSYQMLILDEITSVYNYGLVNDEILLDFLQNKPEHLEIVMTGRNPSIHLVDYADYISNIQKIRHPYDLGISARTGIEK